MRVIAAALLLALGAGAARAQEGPVLLSARDSSTRPLEAKPTERAAATFRDVLRIIYPDLDEAGRARSFAEAQAVPGSTEGEERPAEIDLSRGMYPTFAIVTDGPRDHVAVLSGDVLAVAQVAPSFRPAEPLMVRTDPGGTPSIAQMLLLGEGRPAVVILNSHTNSGESFAHYLIAAPVREQLRQVFESPVLYSAQSWERGCEPRQLEQRMLPVTLRDVQRDGYAELSVSVRVARICTQRGRPRTLNSTMHYARLRWDPVQSRYLGGLDALERRNRQRMGLNGP